MVGTGSYQKGSDPTGSGSATPHCFFITEGVLVVWRVLPCDTVPLLLQVSRLSGVDSRDEILSALEATAYSVQAGRLHVLVFRIRTSFLCGSRVPTMCADQGVRG